MDKAADHARQGDLDYFRQLPAEELSRLCKRRDEDGRSLLQSAASSGCVALCELVVEAGGAGAVNDGDEEVSY